jgi:hypothetical protein
MGPQPAYLFGPIRNRTSQTRCQQQVESRQPTSRDWFGQAALRDPPERMRRHDRPLILPTCRSSGKSSVSPTGEQPQGASFSRSPGQRGAFRSPKGLMRFRKRIARASTLPSRACKEAATSETGMKPTLRHVRDAMSATPCPRCPCPRRHVRDAMSARGPLTRLERMYRTYKIRCQKPDGRNYKKSSIGASPTVT